MVNDLMMLDEDEEPSGLDFVCLLCLYLDFDACNFIDGDETRI
jgi:hypothetical protein